jgi:hypothetical protein
VIYAKQLDELLNELGPNVKKMSLEELRTIKFAKKTVPNEVEDRIKEVSNLELKKLFQLSF